MQKHVAAPRERKRSSDANKTKTFASRRQTYRVGEEVRMPEGTPKLHGVIRFTRGSEDSATLQVLGNADFPYVLKDGGQVEVMVGETHQFSLGTLFVEEKVAYASDNAWVAVVKVESIHMSGRALDVTVYVVRPPNCGRLFDVN